MKHGAYSEYPQKVILLRSGKKREKKRRKMKKIAIGQYDKAERTKKNNTNQIAWQKAHAEK